MPDKADSSKSSIMDSKTTLTAMMMVDEYMNKNKVGLHQLFREFGHYSGGVIDCASVLSGLMKLASTPITLGQAKSLVAFLDKDGKGSIELADFDSSIKEFRMHKKSGNIKDIVAAGDVKVKRDPVFPNWLVDRRDFRLVFTRFQDEDELDEAEQVRHGASGEPRKCDGERTAAPLPPPLFFFFFFFRQCLWLRLRV